MEISGLQISLAQLNAVATGNERIELTDESRDRMRKSRAVVEKILEQGEVIYGISTGFGKLSDVKIEPEALRQLQLNLVRSHSCGIGQPLSIPEVRAMIFLRANVLALGFSGVRLEVVEFLCQMLNRGVYPVVPEKGSVGASGDLAPLAHLALALIGEGESFFEKERLASADALARAGLNPVVLEAKDGLALLNGTQAMHSVGGLALFRAKRLSRVADIAGAMTLEGLMGTPRAFDPRIQKARPHPGQLAVAEHLRALVRQSEIRESHRQNDPRVQDAYSLRCIPQVHGAARDALGYVEKILEIESAGATDNPLVFPESGDVISGGNFHGAPLALALDFAAIALTDLMSISERRIERTGESRLELRFAGLSRAKARLAIRHDDCAGRGGLAFERSESAGASRQHRQRPDFRREGGSCFDGDDVRGQIAIDRGKRGKFACHRIAGSRGSARASTATEGRCRGGTRLRDGPEIC